MAEEREAWSGKTGFILACIGAAMGLGSIWMFPWRIGAYGGGAFMIPYLLFTFGLGVFGLMGEFAFGRSQQKGAIGSFSKVFKEKGKNYGSTLGIIPVIGVTGVFTFYLIVCGWILKYFYLSIIGAFGKIDPGPYFGGFAGQPESIFWHFLALVITLAIIAKGVSGGIEAANKYMMPGLFIILLILLFRSLTLPGAMEGVNFLLIPDWSKLADATTWVMALGQAFFTVSLGGAAMLVYGSYLKDTEDVPSSAMHTAFWTTIASLLAAFVTIPSTFAFNMDVQAGPPLLFITIPMIFKSMTGGYIFGILFFTAVVFAAISSAINLMEVPVEAIMDRFNMSRIKASIIVALAGFIIGIPLDLNMDLFGRFADLVTIYIVPFGAVLAAIVFFWVYGASRAREQINKGAAKPLGKWLEFHTKYVFTIVAIVVLIIGIVQS
ncbi:sodium:neurotransmitter symporter [Desulforamulus reducens MI-1]|uniref:Sodium:neurotransmitter symporter n=1 Tax=Desulforamulus reducens (strain ATCC BAA-1160 / DSM 100696 / MI-1) TaxID=349161 RepID=A4J6M3_DESRM|nr:sodium-dependent transporter [Desulforamulus reducens]ABO50726.1 sodium:neurotransmitter symporter [Desulforamulus reducens MI-1]